MLTAGRNPTRRNRNIGKTQGGRVRNGRAEEKQSHLFTNDIWERLSNLEGSCVVLRENPSRDYFHPCTGDEYLELLGQLPEDISPPQAIVLRRLSKLDEERGIDARKRYFCVILNSFSKSMEMPFQQREPSEKTIHHYEPWCRRWERKGRLWRLVWSLEEIRRYYLYHLFLHELGHLNQPLVYSGRLGESFAENFALEWAHRLRQL